MDFASLGSTGIRVNKNGFGALPIQRISEGDAVYLLKKAYDNGITFYDTARFYTDSEKKIGLALSGVRERIFIATKTMPGSVSEFWEQLETSLGLLKTDYVDVYQFHNPSFCPKPGDGSGLYGAMLEAKAQGKVRHIGITNHRLGVALEAARSGLYEIIQFPVSYLASADELDLVRVCNEHEIGVLGMKSLAGGLITNSAAAYAFMMQYDNLLPIWGIQSERELDEFISYQTAPPVLGDELRHVIERDASELSGDFCRGCGYCMPCPAGIDISIAARMSLLIRRAPKSMWLSSHLREGMTRIDSCTNCGHCRVHCPYGLDAIKLMQAGWREYKEYL